MAKLKAEGFPCDNLYILKGLAYQVSHVIVVLRLADYGGTEAECKVALYS